MKFTDNNILTVFRSKILAAYDGGITQSTLDGAATFALKLYNSGLLSTQTFHKLTFDEMREFGLCTSGGVGSNYMKALARAGIVLREHGADGYSYMLHYTPTKEDIEMANNETEAKLRETQKALEEAQAKLKKVEKQTQGSPQKTNIKKTPKKPKRVRRDKTITKTDKNGIVRTYIGEVVGLPKELEDRIKKTRIGKVIKSGHLRRTGTVKNHAMHFLKVALDTGAITEGTEKSYSVRDLTTLGLSTSDHTARMSIMVLQKAGLLKVSGKPRGNKRGYTLTLKENSGETLGQAVAAPYRASQEAQKPAEGEDQALVKIALGVLPQGQLASIMAQKLSKADMVSILAEKVSKVDILEAVLNK